MAPLSHCQNFINLLTLFNNPFFGIFIGALLTAIIQSSSASVGMLQALALKVNISCGAALPIIMGQNIGTCITAVISSIGVNANARKVAVVHLSFNYLSPPLHVSFMKAGPMSVLWIIVSLGPGTMQGIRGHSINFC